MNSIKMMNDIAHIIMGQSPKKKDVNDIGNGDPLLNGPTEFTSRYPNAVQYTTGGRKFSEKGDILFCVRGSTTGRMNYSDQPYAIGRGLAAIRGKKGYPTPFIKAVIENNLDRLLTAATGSTFPNVSKSLLHKFEVKIISPEQAHEANQILVSLEKKIHLNQQTNQTIESMAQALFKSWFVDFDPVRAKIRAKAAGRNPQRAAMAAISGVSMEQDWDGVFAQLDQKLNQMREADREQLAKSADLFPLEMMDSELGAVPKGWEVVELQDEIDFQNGKAFRSKDLEKDLGKGLRVFKMGNIEKGGGFERIGGNDFLPPSFNQDINRYLLKKGDLLMCMTDMKNKVALLGHTALMDVDNEYVLNQRVGRLRKKESSYIEYPFLYYLTNSTEFIEDLRSRANSGVQVNLSTKEIKATKFLLPPNGVHNHYNYLVKKVLEKKFQNDKENVSLSGLRDALLPKLISGNLLI